MSSSNAYGVLSPAQLEALREVEDHLRAAEVALLRVTGALVTAGGGNTPELKEWRALIRLLVEVRVELQRAAGDVS